MLGGLDDPEVHDQCRPVIAGELTLGLMQDPPLLSGMIPSPMLARQVTHWQSIPDIIHV
jgi:hypothetical protein